MTVLHVLPPGADLRAAPLPDARELADDVLEASPPARLAWLRSSASAVRRSAAGGPLCPGRSGRPPPPAALCAGIEPGRVSEQRPETERERGGPAARQSGTASAEPGIHAEDASSSRALSGAASNILVSSMLLVLN